MLETLFLDNTIQIFVLHVAAQTALEGREHFNRI